MKDLNRRVSKFFLILSITFFIVGCASEPVKIDWPANHPTNPETQEAEFTPPPNPFQEDVTAMKRESAPDSMIKNKTHKEGDKQQMDHNMGTKKESRPDSKSTKKSGHGEVEDQHKGHSQ